MPSLPLSFEGSDITLTARFLGVFEYELPLVQGLGFKEHLLERPDCARIEGQIVELLTGYQNLVLRALIRKYGHVCDLVIHGQSMDPTQAVPLFTLKGCTFREMGLGIATDDLCVDATYPFTAVELVEHGHDPEWKPVPTHTSDSEGPVLVSPGPGARA